MFAGLKTTEFWLVLIVIGFAILTAAGVLTPDRIEQVATNIQETTGALPKLLNVLQGLFNNTALVALASAVVWMYTRRRSDLKVKKLEYKIEKRRSSPTSPTFRDREALQQMIVNMSRAEINKVFREATDRARAIREKEMAETKDGG